MTDYLPILIAAAVFIGYAVLKKHKAKQPTRPPTPWRINHSAGVPDAPTMQGAGWHIDIPAAPGHLNYVQWYGEPPLRVGGSITIRYRIEGGPIIQAENPAAPATAGLMVQRKGDTLSGQGKYAGYRWFCRQHFPLTEGEHSFTVPLDETAWGNVMRDPQSASFPGCLRESDNLSIVFGGAGGRGHGVYGAGRFTLLELRVA